MPPLTAEESELEEKAFLFVRNHKVELIKKFADPDVYQSVPIPVSLFMAGSPGAGKTEVSRGLVRKFKDAPVRIDADEIRTLCPEYTGANAHVFQKAANKGVNTLFDYVLHKESTAFSMVLSRMRALAKTSRDRLSTSVSWRYGSSIRIL